MAWTLPLFKQQEVGAKYLSAHNGGCLWMEMRTGKTLTTLKALADGGHWPALIVCPKNIFMSWSDQALMAGASSSNIQVLDGSKAKVEMMLDDPKALNLINYEKTWRYDVLKFPWKAVVLDESIKIGNMDTQVTQYFLENADEYNFDFTACLSGSPASEDLFQLLPQMFWQKGGEFFGYKGLHGLDDYVGDYWRYSDAKNKWVLKRRSHRRELLAWNEQNSFQCTMKDIGMDSPLLFRTHRIKPPKSLADRVNSLRIGDVYWSQNQDKNLVINPLTKASFEMSLCAGRDPMNGEIFDSTKQSIVIEEWDGKEQFIVFSRLKDPLVLMEEMFSRVKGAKCKFISSGCQGFDQAIRDFQAGKLHGLFAQTDSVKMGTTLDKASKIYYLNNSLSLDTRTQSQMRGTSMNKRTPVEVVDLVFEGCYEEMAAEKLRNKKKLSDQAVQTDYKDRFENAKL